MRRNARSITYYNNDGCERCEDLDKNLVAITASHTFSLFTRCDDDREAQLQESRKENLIPRVETSVTFPPAPPTTALPIQTGECVPKKNWTHGLNNFSNLFQTIISYLWPGAVEPCSAAWKNAEMKIKTGSWIKEQKFNIEIIQFESCKADGDRLGPVGGTGLVPDAFSRTRAQLWWAPCAGTSLVPHLFLISSGVRSLNSTSFFSLFDSG